MFALVSGTGWGNRTETTLATPSWTPSAPTVVTSVRGRNRHPWTIGARMRAATSTSGTVVITAAMFLPVMSASADLPRGSAVATCSQYAGPSTPNWFTAVRPATKAVITAKNSL